MKFKVFQIKRRINRTLYFVVIGEVEIKNPSLKLDDVLDDIWHACNVSSWGENNLWELSRRINLDTLTMTISEEFSGVANSDIIVTSEDKINFTAETFAWKSHPTLEAAKRSLMEKYSNVKSLLR